MSTSLFLAISHFLFSLEGKKSPVDLATCSFAKLKRAQSSQLEFRFSCLYSHVKAYALMESGTNFAGASRPGNSLIRLGSPSVDPKMQPDPPTSRGKSIWAKALFFFFFLFFLIVMSLHKLNMLLCSGERKKFKVFKVKSRSN